MTVRILLYLHRAYKVYHKKTKTATLCIRIAVYVWRRWRDKDRNASRFFFPPPSHSRRASLDTLAFFGSLLWAVSPRQNDYQSFWHRYPRLRRSSSNLLRKTKKTVLRLSFCCERAVKRCVNVGKNSEKYTSVANMYLQRIRYMI